MTAKNLLESVRSVRILNILSWAASAALLLLIFLPTNALALNAPVVSPNNKVFSVAPQAVTITATGGASIYYTTNGTTPSATNGTHYTAAFNVSVTTTLKSIAILSGTSSAVTTTYLKLDATTANVPQTGLELWVMGDSGTVVTGSSLTSWADFSGKANTATQTTSAAEPTVVASAINGLPAVSFNGTSQYLKCPSGSSNFSNGFSAYVVTKPTTITDNSRFFDLSSGSAASEFSLTELGTTGANVNINGTGIVPAASALTAGQYQVLDTNSIVSNIDGQYHTGLYTNGQLQGQAASYSAGPSGTLSTKLLGTDFSKTHYLNGQIAEILIYDSSEADSSRANIELYLATKYNLPISPPSISPSNGVFSSGPQAVTMTAGSGLQIRYTIDGSQPSTSSTLYSASFNVTGSTVVKAIAVQGTKVSPVATSYIQIDPATANLPTSGLQSWLKADYGTQTTGSSVTSWADMSGNNNNVVQSTTAAQPTFVANAYNTLPAVNFNGTSQYMSWSSLANYANLNYGAFIFVAVKPTTIVDKARFFDFSSGSAASEMSFSEAGTTGISYGTNGGATGNIITANNSLLSSAFQVLEFDAFNLNVYVDSVNQPLQGSISNFPSLPLSKSLLGTDFTIGNFLNGQVAEILIYNSDLNTTQRQAVEQYLMTRYAPPPPPPSITPKTGVYAPGQQVTITAQTGTVIHYTVDGSPALPSSPVYSSAVTLTSPTVVNAIATLNNSPSTQVTAYLDVDAASSSVSQTGLQLWLKPDFAILTGAPPTGSPFGSVLHWLDLSGNGNNAVPGATSPYFVPASLNGYPAVFSALYNDPSTFGSLMLPPGFSNFSSGLNAFLVVRALTSKTPSYLLDLGNGANSDNFTIKSIDSPSNASFSLNNGANSSSLSSPTGFSSNLFQILEVQQSGTTGYLAVNGQTISGNLPVLNTITRSTNNIFSNYDGFARFNGALAEMLIYNQPLTSAQKTVLYSYLTQKYFPTPIPPAPIISVPTGTLTGPTQVAVYGITGATIRFTSDGSTPGLTSSILLNPINVAYSQTLKCIAVVNGVASPVSSATYALNSTQWPAPNATDATPLQINLDQPVNSIPK